MEGRSPATVLLHGRRASVHTPKAMNDVELQDPGYYMLCYVGIHIYALNTCIHCGRKDRNTQVEYKPAQE